MIDLREALAPLQSRPFLWFFLGRSISTLGSVMAPIALAFAVLSIESSPVALGQVLAARSVPLVLLLLLGGVVADRLSRSLVLQVSHLLSGLTQGVAAYLVITGQATLSQLIVLEALNGVVTAFTMPAIQGVVPQVVPRSHLQQANALLAFSRSGVSVIGPAMAGVMVVGIGPGWALAADALSWLLAAACMVPLALPGNKNARVGRSGVVRDLASGWSRFRSITWLWVVVLAFGLLNAIHAGAWLTLGPVLAADDPAIGKEGWGYAVSALAVGLLLLTVVMMRLTFRYPLRAGLLAMLGLAAPLFALGLSWPLIWLLIASFLAGAGIEVFGISWQTAIHQNVPEDHLSRVAAYDSLGSFVAIPLGQLTIGPLAAAFGTHQVVFWSAVAFVLVILATLAVPEVRNLTGPHADRSRGRANRPRRAAHQPADHSSDHSADQPADQPADRLADRPGVQPGGQP